MEQDEINVIGKRVTDPRVSRLMTPLTENWENDNISIQSSVISDDNEYDGDIQIVPTGTNQFHSLVVNHSRKKTSGSTWYAAVFLIVNAALGAGLLNFPQAYDNAGGIAVALVIQGCLMVFIFGSLVILAYCSDINKATTYQEVVLNMCGKKAHKCCAIILSIYCYGCCMTFLVIIGDQFDRTFASMYGNDFCHKWYMTREFTIIVSAILLILPMCFSRKIDFLKYASSMGVIATIYVVAIVVNEYFKADTTHVVVRKKPKVWSDVFMVMPVICFGYQCHVSVVPIYSCMKNRTISNFLKSSTMALFICVTVYSVAAIFGYLTFGVNVDSDILKSYKSHDAYILIGIIALAAKLVTTYPILLFCGRTAIDGLWIEFRKLDSVDIASGERKRRIITVLIWFITNIILAVFVPNIGDIIEFLGTLAAFFIFIFPGLCLMQITWKNDPGSVQLKSKLFIIAGGGFVVVGTFIFGLLFVQSIYIDISGTAHKDKLCS